MNIKNSFSRKEIAMRFVFLAILAVVLAACSTTSSNIISLSNQHYRVLASSKTNGESLRVATEKASQYCAKQRRRLVVTELKSNYVGLRAPKNFIYHANIEFICAPPLKEAV